MKLYIHDCDARKNQCTQEWVVTFKISTSQFTVWTTCADHLDMSYLVCKETWLSCVCLTFCSSPCHLHALKHLCSLLFFIAKKTYMSNKYHLEWYGEKMLRCLQTDCHQCQMKYNTRDKSEGKSITILHHLNWHKTNLGCSIKKPMMAFWPIVNKDLHGKDMMNRIEFT